MKKKKIILKESIYFSHFKTYIQLYKLYMLKELSPIVFITLNFIVVDNLYPNISGNIDSNDVRVFDH